MRGVSLSRVGGGGMRGESHSRVGGGGGMRGESLRRVGGGDEG